MNDNLTSNTSPTQIPVKVKLAVLFSVISEHTSLFLSPIVIVYLIEHVSEDKSPESISYKVGLQEGLSRIIAAVGVLVWSTMSDRIGRKYSLMITMSGIAISSIGTGLSTTFSGLLFWRAFSGCFAGTLPVIKAVISDVTDNSNIAVLYKYFGSGYGFASVIGPMIGWVFSRPYTKLAVFDTDFFHDRPYFLPFLIHACISLSALTFVMLTVPYKPPQRVANSNHSLIRNRKFLSIALIFFMHGFVQFSYRTLLSLWLSADKDFGGIGWKNEQNPGLMNALGGGLVAGIPFLLAPRIISRFGVVKSIALLETMMVPFLVVVSVANSLDGVALWMVLVVAHGATVAFITMGTSFISICITNSVPEHAVGLAVGVSQSFTSVSRSAGATVTAYLFGAFVGKEYVFPFDTHFVFMCNCAVLVLNAFMVLKLLDSSIEKRVEVKESLIPGTDMELTEVPK